MPARPFPDNPLGPGPLPLRATLHIAAAFAVGGAAWVLVTDLLLYALSDEQPFVARIELAKGWAFVAFAALLVCGIALVHTRRIAHDRRLLATIVESMGDGLLLLGPDRRIVHANPAAAALLGATPEALTGMGAEAFSRRFRVSFRDGSLVPPGQFVSQRVFDEGGPLRYTCVLHPPGREEVVVSCTAAAVRERAGAPPTFVVSVLHDTTPTEHLESLRDGLFASAAHALKTPVAVVCAHARILSREASPRAQRSAAVVERQCAQMEVLVENLLVAARAHSGSLRLHPRLVPLSSVLQRVAGDRVVASLDRPVDTRIVEDAQAYVDDERLVTALRNVVVDAAHASDGALTLLLRRCGVAAELGVAAQGANGPAPARDDLAVALEVTEIIVGAHGGSQHRERVDGDETRWIRLPLPEE
jgi:two-component system, NtrC family, sensor histidine kinase KinB